MSSSKHSDLGLRFLPSVFVLLSFCLLVAAWAFSGESLRKAGLQSQALSQALTEGWARACALFDDPKKDCPKLLAALLPDVKYTLVIGNETLVDSLGKEGGALQQGTSKSAAVTLDGQPLWLTVDTSILQEGYLGQVRDRLIHDGSFFGAAAWCMAIVAAIALKRAYLAKQAFADLAACDALTLLGNRRALQAQGAKYIAQARRRKSPLVLLYLDLDKFKRINDEHGHDAGDAVLQAVASRIKDSIRDSDAAFRLGGDEFCVLLTTLAQSRDAADVAQRICREVRKPINFRGAALSLAGASVGIQELDLGDGKSLEDTLRAALAAADQAAYRAKSEGAHGWAWAPGAGDASLPQAKA